MLRAIIIGVNRCLGYPLIKCVNDTICVANLSNLHVNANGMFWIGAGNVVQIGRRSQG